MKIFNLIKMVELVLQMDRTHFGRRRNCQLRAISPILTAFSEDLYCRHIKTRACSRKGQVHFFSLFGDELT